LNCENGGGVGAIIYNNIPGALSGMLSPNSATVVPVMGISQEDGLALLEGYEGQSTTLTVREGYGYMSGTRYVRWFP